MSTDSIRVQIGADGHSIEGAEHLLSLRTFTTLLSTLVSDMIPLVESRYSFGAPEHARSRVLVAAMDELLGDMHRRTVNRQQVRDTCSSEQLAELEELLGRLHGCHYRAVRTLWRLKMAIAFFIMRMQEWGGENMWGVLE